MISARRRTQWLTTAVVLLAVGTALALAAVPSRAGTCPNGAAKCTCPQGSTSCHCPPGHPRTQDYCTFCRPGSVYNPKTRKCQTQKSCLVPQSGKHIKYFGSRKPLLCFRPPKAITKPARHVQKHSAVLPGVVIDPHHFKTRWYFRWGKCPHLNHRTKGGHVHKRTLVRITLRHLHPGTVYCYRLVVSNKRGKARGKIKRFHVKGQPPPKPITGPARGVHRRSVTLRGVVLDPSHLKTRWYFVWGACPVMNHRTKGGYVHQRTPVSVTLHHLKPGVIYCYRLVATSRTGTGQGAVKHVRTMISKPPKKPHGFTG